MLYFDPYIQFFHDLGVHLHGFGGADDPEDDEDENSGRVDERGETDDGAATETPDSRTTSGQVASGSSPSDVDSTECLDDEEPADGDA